MNRAAATAHADGLDSECASGERACASNPYREVVAHIDDLSCGCPYCAERVHVAVKVTTDYPGLWLDKSAVTLEHDPHDPVCECLACQDERTARGRMLSQWLLEDHEALAIQIENDNVARSEAPTSRPPRMSVSEAAAGEVEEV